MTCWAFTRLALALLLVLFAAPPFSYAETGVVSAVGTGKDSADAIGALLRSSVSKYFKSDALAKSVLQNEIIPNSASFVQSYKILEGRGSSVSVSANLDLDVIKSLLALTPENLGEEKGAKTKAVVFVKGTRLPEESKKTDKSPDDPYAVLERAIKERLQRRSFLVVDLSEKDSQAIWSGEDASGPELLRGMGVNAGARIAVGVSAHLVNVDNEHSHSKEERIALDAAVVDVKTGALLGKKRIDFRNPRVYRTLYAQALQKELLEESRDFLQDLFVSSGRHVLGEIRQDDFSVVRVLYASNPTLLAKFRALLEADKSINSVLEYRMQRGAFDLAVRPVLEKKKALKIIQGLSSEEIAVNIEEGIEDSSERPPLLSIQIAAKELPVTNTEGEEKNEKDR